MARPKHSARRKASFKDEPIDVAELAGMSNVEGMLSFLNRKPEEYAQLFHQPEAESSLPSTPAVELTTVAAEPTATVAVESTATVADCHQNDVYELAATVADGPPATVAAELNLGGLEPTTTVAADTHPAPQDPTTTVAVEPTTTVEAAALPAGLWYTEGKEGVFPSSRIRRILRAQDALTHTEESVYNVLWGPKNQTKELVRYTSFGYDVLAKAARVTKMNAKHIIERLIYKGFVQVHALPDVLRRIPTQYAVCSYRAALENMARRNRQFVVRTGNGVLFAHPADPTTTVAAESPTTVAAEQSATVTAGQPATVAVGQSTTVAATATLLDINTLDKTPSYVGAPALVAGAIIKEFGFVDDDALTELVRQCRQNASDATDTEIAEIAAMTAHRIRRMSNLTNPVGLLITQTARCFVGEPFRIYRQENAERERKFRALYESQDS